MKWFRHKPAPTEYIDVTVNGRRLMHLSIKNMKAAQKYMRGDASFFDVQGPARIGIKVVER